MAGQGMRDLPEQLDVLIVGAGISGIGAACHLQQRVQTSSSPSSKRWILSAAPG
jgi:NADH dehydrogenase FAD-containing subunit